MKPLQDLVEFAESLGASVTVEPGRKGTHTKLVLTHSGRTATVTVSLTPGDHRQPANARCDLRKTVRYLTNPASVPANHTRRNLFR